MGLGPRALSPGGAESLRGPGVEAENEREVRTEGPSSAKPTPLDLAAPGTVGPILRRLLLRLSLRAAAGVSSTAFILWPVSSFSFFFHSRSDQELLPSVRIRFTTSRISKYPYLLCFGMANMSDLASRTLATRRPGRPYKPKVSQVGNINLSSISNPLTAGGTSGMMKTKPSVDEGGSE